MRSPGSGEEPPEEERRAGYPRGEGGAEYGSGTENASGASSALSGPRRGKKKSKKGSFWRELPILIGTALVLTILIQAFVARVYVIPSQSMEQTLHGCSGCNNDRILVDKISYRFGEPEPGDVVVFRGPDTWMQNEFETPEATNPVARFFGNVGSLLGFPAPNEKDFVKRVIATEGQTVACCTPRNQVTVNGEPLDEPYVYWEPGRGRKQQEFGPVTVPANHLWVMGDNRNDSADSRVQGGGGVRGAVPVQNVIGKAQFIVLPPTRWQSIPEPNPQTMALGVSSDRHSGLPAGTGLAVTLPVLWAGWRRNTLAPRRGAREYYWP
ncbi:signal peptidase I [Halopolyspora algeriensis]|uniref:Signal peptidase I n=2 Tax=Halopolyspora algeriensis TaxID=1500506 RepID=A0A368VJM4_9ACTN|nr:signal peptidase I [Halopolyspora algeriensis]TQM56499.1 signal peptidase I [Halopolyspora algeriensis]